MLRRKRKKNRLERVEVINQRTGRFLLDLPPPAVEGFALDRANDKNSDDLLFIGIDRSGYTYDSWTLSDVLAGHFVV